MGGAGRFAAAVLTVVLGAGVAACGGSGPATAPSGAPAAAVPAGKVSANAASEADLVAAFEAAGVPNAENWAEEVEEYRPYPADDPNFAKLRGELAKHNPGPGVVDKIVSVLAP